METLQKALAAVRDLAPYFLVEPLLPGASVAILLLWLSNTFIRNGFSGVRQYLHTSRAATPVSAANGRARSGRRDLCVNACAVVATWRDRIVQWCEKTRAAALKTTCAPCADTL